MEINYWAVLVCAVLSMIVGYVWYGPLFGKKWAEIMGADATDLEARSPLKGRGGDMISQNQMQKRAMPLYAVQFLLTLFQVWVLAYYIQGWKDASGLENSLWIWAAFVVPIIAGGAMWNNDSAKVSWARFLIQSGYQLVMFAIFGLILGMWK
ncbi:MAG: DUF1761 domain-containing protein [bacterium]|nr:DUF1761 domain-containing protein [bacterium]